jgi:hypothetical protein
MAIGSMIAIVVVAAPASATTITVDCSHASLATAISSAPSDATLKISGVCTGNFVVDRNLTLTGLPTAKLNGAGSGSTLSIFGFHAVHLSHLSIVGGVAHDGGGIQFTGGGLLTLDHVTVSGNSATGGTTPGAAHGGGIDVKDPAFVTLTNSTVKHNHVSVSGANAETATGGGLYVQGQLTITDSTVKGNTASGTSNNNAGIGEGAGIGASGSLILTGATVTGNQATGTGPQFGLAHGGGIYWIPFQYDALNVIDSTVASNVASASTPGEADAFGGGLFTFANGASAANIHGSTFDGNQATATSSASRAIAMGGAIFGNGSTYYPVLKASGSTFSNSSLSATGATTAQGEGGAVYLFGSGSLSRTTVTANTLTIHAGSGTATGGGAGLRFFAMFPINIGASTIDDNGADATSGSGATSISGGGILSGGPGPLTVRTSTVSRNGLAAHASDVSAEALGGGISFNGTNTNPGDTVIDSTVAGNTAAANSTSGPDAAGGGIAVFDKLLTLRFDTLARNSVSSQGVSAFAGAGGLYDETGTNTHLEAVIVALNQAAIGPDCVGNATSDGFNLFGTTAGCSVTTVGSDQTNPAPKLGPLGTHGGPTQTVSLRAGSPALNKMGKTACQAIVKKDQRGVARPQGTKCDEGAFELQP